MGLKEFFNNPGLYAHSRGRLVRDLVTGLPEIRRMRRDTQSWDQLINFTFEFADGFMQPLQVRSELKRALETIEKEQPRRIMEIGTARGGTFFLLSRAARPDARLISLDLPGGRYGGGYSNWKTSVYRRLMLPGQSADFVRSNSHEPASRRQVETLLDGARLDLLFIDGDHTYEGVKKDFLLYRDLVRHGGLIVFHDVAKHPPEKHCEVDRFWAEVKEQYPSEEIIADPKQGWAGIGVLRYSPA